MWAPFSSCISQIFWGSVAALKWGYGTKGHHVFVCVYGYIFVRFLLHYSNLVYNLLEHTRKSIRLQSKHFWIPGTVVNTRHFKKPKLKEPKIWWDPDIVLHPQKHKWQQRQGQRAVGTRTVLPVPWKPGCSHVIHWIVIFLNLILELMHIYQIHCSANLKELR